MLLGACSTASAPAPSAAVTPGTAPASVPASTGPAGPPSSGGSSGAACTIVTADAVSQATGFPVKTESGTGAICFFQNADLSKYLTVQLYGSQAEMGTILQIESGSEHIAGLGDDAFWTPTAGILFVRKGDHGIEFLDPDLGASPTDTASRDALVTLARTALPKL
jgi:hypothetical protein